MLYRIQGDILLLKCLTVHVWNFSVNYQLSDCYRVVYIWKVGKEMEGNWMWYRNQEGSWGHLKAEYGGTQRKTSFCVCMNFYWHQGNGLGNAPLGKPHNGSILSNLPGIFFRIFFSWCCCFCCQQPLQVCCWVTPP